MKKQNILLIVLGLIVIAGGVWFFTRDNTQKTENELSAEENNPAETPSDAVELEKDKESDKTEEPQTDETDQTSPVEENKPSTVEIEVGKPAPDFNLRTLSGEDVSLSDYQGKIVLLNFWATWCGFCVKEMPDLDKFDKEHEDVVVLAVDVMEEEDKVRDYIEGGGYDFEVALDLDGQISRDYLVSAYPTSYFIDTDGSLIGRVAGMLEYEQMLEILDSIKGDR